MKNNLIERRYDIDWIRVVTISLLIIYHTAIVFQPWGLMIGFMTNDEKWESFWIPMMMLNVWRIPILFFISGIGVYFSFQSRTWQQLIKERFTRIGIPFVFGSLFIVPLYMYILQKYYSWKVEYLPNPGHLWFLGNILLYVIFTLPFFHLLKRKEGSHFSNSLKKVIANPIFLLILVGSFICEVYVLKPPIYEMYAMTLHGLFLGLLAFIAGYLFAYGGDGLWQMLMGYKYIFLVFAVALFFIRIGKVIPLPYSINLPIETCMWIFSIFGFARQYLNKPYKYLDYLSKAAYPVYILHMVFLGLGSWIILPLKLLVEIKFIALIIFTFIACLGCYQIIKSNYWSRLLFGLEKKQKTIKEVVYLKSDLKKDSKNQ